MKRTFTLLRYSIFALALSLLLAYLHPQATAQEKAQPPNAEVRLSEKSSQQIQQLRRQALLQQEQGQGAQAERTIAQALELAQIHQDSFSQAQVLNTLGSLQLQRGQSETAYATYRQAERIYRALGDRSGSILSQLNQVQALQSLGFYTRARGLLADIQTHLSQQPDDQLKVHQLRNLGSILQQIGEMEQAQAALSQALAIAQTQSEAEVAAIHFQLGNFAQIQQDWEQANQHYQAVTRWSNASRWPEILLSFQKRHITSWTTANLKNSSSTLSTFLSNFDRSSSNRATPEPLNSGPLNSEPLNSEPLNAEPSSSEPLNSDRYRLGLESQLQQLRIAVRAIDPGANTQKSQVQAIAQAKNLHFLLGQLPLSRWAIDAQIHWAESLIQLQQTLERSGTQPVAIGQHITDQRLQRAGLTPHVVAEQLKQALAMAHQLQDPRAEAAVLGQLGALYEHNRQFSDALTFTRHALDAIANTNAPDLAAAWHWQAGRLLKQRGDSETAIAHYRSAVKLLQTLRQDLVAMTPDLQFSFRDQVEPIYRQQIQLLLAGVDQLPPDLKQQRLEESRQTLEALQLAELQNFFREACQTYEPRSIDQIDPHAAVLYSLVLDGQLEVVLSLPNQPLQHYGTALSATEAQNLLSSFRQSLNPAFRPDEGRPAAQRLYDALIRPAEDIFEASDIQTLVFVLDDFLRNVPLAALHDGDRYLIEKYNLALTPGLQLFESQPLTSRKNRLLAGGISKAHQGFAPLPGVTQELQALSEQAKARVFVDQDFSTATLAKQLENNPFSIVHLATHGQFSSRAQETFLLAWDDRIEVQELDRWLSQRQFQEGHHPSLELLTLSACQTAKGDDRATLGMAGMAVRSGARTTVATLWSVQDESTSQLMDYFYQQLFKPDIDRAKALRQAQIQLLQGDYSHPYYWAPFVMVGNWQ